MNYVHIKTLGCNYSSKPYFWRWCSLTAVEGMACLSNNIPPFHAYVITYKWHALDVGLANICQQQTPQTSGGLFTDMD